MNPTRLFDILTQLSFQKNTNLLNAKENKQWKNYSTDDFIQAVESVSYGLIYFGLNPGDKVAILSNNRPEWNFVDYGAQQTGIITVPIYPTISVSDLTYILQNSEVKAVFLSSSDLHKKIEAVKANLAFEPMVFSFNEIEGVNSFASFLSLGASNPQRDELQRRKDEVNPNEMFTMLYTSGTTGVPKGVMLSHQNILSNVEACFPLAPFQSHWRALSFLPLNHIYERMVTTLYLRMNISIYYAEGFETIADNLKEIKPQIFVSVPRLIERVYDKLLSAGEKLQGWKRKLFFSAVDFALAYDPQKTSLKSNIQRAFFDRLIYTKWRAALGGNVVCIASGGAALQPRLGKVFYCAKIPILEGYGLTETSPVIAVNCYNPNDTRIGTVGPVIQNTQVKIAQDGEILVKGPGVMLGYYKNPEATNEMINEDGWLHTGDIGTFVEERFLKITDRKKEIFKTSAGKYIAPLMIENKIKACRFVEQCCVIGESQKFASALIVLSKDYLREWSKKEGLTIPFDEHLVNHPSIKKEINGFIRELNKTLAPYEQIKRPELILEPWTIDGGELTPKLSMKRKVILQKHADLFAKIFSEGE